MDIQIPEEIFKIQKFEATVRSNENVATFILISLLLYLPVLAVTIQRLCLDQLDHL